MAKNDTNKELIKQYGAGLNTDIIQKMSKAYAINNRYQLSAGTEKDFNNAVNFLKHSKTKDSKTIDDYETRFSSLFGSLLVKYFNTNITEKEVTNLLTAIAEYNEDIINKYSIDFDNNLDTFEWKQLTKTLEDICGIDTNTLAIKPNSIAERIYKEIEKATISNDSIYFSSRIYTTADVRQNIISILTLYALTSNFMNNSDIKNTVAIPEEIFPFYNQDENKKNYIITENENYHIKEIQSKRDLSNNIEYKFNINTRKLCAKIDNKFGVYTPEKKVESTKDNEPYLITIGECNDYIIKFGEMPNINSISIYYNVPDSKSKTDQTKKVLVCENISLADITYRTQSLDAENRVATILNSAKVINLVNSHIKQNNPGVLGLNANEKIIVSGILKDDIELNLVFYSLEFNKTSDIVDIPTYTSLSFFIKNKFKTDNPCYSFYATEKISKNNKDVLDEHTIMLNTFKIYTEIANISESNDINVQVLKNTITKNSADSIETYYALKHTNVVPITLNLFASAKSELYQVLHNYFNYNSTTDTMVRIGIIYKEFNPYIRDLDFSDIQNRIIGEYIAANKNLIIENKTIINSNLYNAMTNLQFGKIFNETERKLAAQTKTNDLVIRNSVVNDLISYISGDIIGFGQTMTEQDDITILLNLYKECRDYFYKILYNTSFMFDDTYEIYVVLFIKAQTIERFMSSRLDNFLSIDHFTAEDCRNFMISYGLKALSDQVDSKDFPNSLDYKKRMIADYNNVMSKKGSRSVIDEFFKIFNYDQNEIEIYKYLIFAENNAAKLPDSTPAQPTTKSVKSSKRSKAVPMTASEPVAEDPIKIKFASAPYYSKNIMHDISYAVEKNTAENYKDFIASDKYWNSDELSEEEVSSILVSPINTKYLGLDLKKDLYRTIITSKYILSLNDYLYKNLFLTNSASDANGNAPIPIYSTKFFRISMPEFLLPSFAGNFDLGFFYNMSRLLFSIYIYYYEKQTHINNSTDEISLESPKYLGINETAVLDDIFNNNFYPDILNLFNTHYGIYEESKVVSDTLSITTKKFKLKNDSPIHYYLNGVYINPFDIDNNTEYYFTENPLSGESVLPPNKELFKLLPLSIVSYDYAGKEIKGPTALKNDKYNAFEYTSKDIHFASDRTSFLTSLPILNETFESINIINLFNELNKKNNDHSDPKINDEKASFTKMIFYFNKFKNNREYPYDFGNFDYITGGNDFKLTDFYKNLYEKIINFPLNYLVGKYNFTTNMKYSKRERDIIDKIFDTYFLTDKPIIPITRQNDSENIGVTSLNQILELLYLSVYATDENFTKTKFIDEVLTPLFKQNEIKILAVTLDSESNFQCKLSDGDYLELSKATNELLVQIVNTLNVAVEECQDMKLMIETTDSVNNFFDFIITSVSFFISYTSLLYKTNLIMNVDTELERIPITYDIKDTISHKISEYFYSDESVTITETN